MNDPYGDVVPACVWISAVVNGRVIAVPTLKSITRAVTRRLDERRVEAARIGGEK